MLQEYTPVISAPVEAWLRVQSDEPKEFILEFKRSKRTIRVESIDPKRRVFSKMSAENALQGDVKPETIGESIQKITHRDTVLLKSSGAIAFLANARELSQIALIPGVKIIRFNRHHLPIRQAGVGD